MITRRLTLTVVLCLLLGAVLFSASAAMAAGSPVVEEESVVDVAGTSATLQATIDPAESETTYRFEYGTSETYGSEVPIPDGLVGSGSVGVTVSAHPQDLFPSTTYHYRVVAVVASRNETVPGIDGTFTTQAAGSELTLPDGRQWELVTPPDKNGAQIYGLHEVGPIQAAEGGGAITYQTNVPLESKPAGYVSQSQTLSVRGADGWSLRDIASPNDTATRTIALTHSEYQFFSSDLSAGLAFPDNEHAESQTLLSSEASELTPYIRREGLCDNRASASECYLPVLTGKEGFANVPPGTEFGGPNAVRFEGASPDLSHVLLSTNVALTEAPGTSSGGLYEWSANGSKSQALQLVDLLPASEGGGAVSGGKFGLDSNDFPTGSRHAISDDGSRVFWESTEEHLYMRDTVKNETVRLDVKQPGAPSGGSTGGSHFQIASSDGSKVFFTNHDGGLTAQSGTTGSDLYECEIVEEAGKLACRLTDLTPENNGQPAEVQHMVLGASENGSYVYFVANGILSSSGATTQGTCDERFITTYSSEACNLYVYHEGVVTFIARLTRDDEFDWGSNAPPSVGDLTARVSSNGLYLAFMSEVPLTGYDNLDANSGKPDQEVYLYDAQAKRLACVSCDPTGDRPVGVEDEKLSAGQESANLVDIQTSGGTYGSETWIAANLPAGDILEPFAASLYQPRVLFDSGRLFFNSDDALVPQDVNGQEDVYEFEPEGAGNCTSADSTFNQKTGGCVSLVSSGSSPEESGFMDASEGGGDAFFLTTSKLVPQDIDTALDVYDAHECSASSPCVTLSVPAPPCDTGDSCKPAPSPQPTIFGAPASSTFTGSGNVTPSLSPKPVVRAKSLTRAQKLAKALDACRKKPKRKRAVCRRQAMKQYGAKGAHKTAKSSSKDKG